MTPTQGLINRLWTGRQTALEGGQREANGTFATTILKPIRAIHFFRDILRYGFVESSLRTGELVGGCVGAALWKQPCAVEAQHFFFDHSPHEVGNVHFVSTVPEFSVEPI